MFYGPVKSQIAPICHSELENPVSALGGAGKLTRDLRLPMTTLLFELCAESVEAASAAQVGGADRIELCSELARGGLTPDPALLTASIAAVSIPVYVLIRPRSGDFVFSSEEFALMQHQVEQAKGAGAAGIAVGVLLANGRVDVERTRALIEQARPMKATFHRAFDETPDLCEALEDVIETGADSLLTSGGAAEVLRGADCIGSLVRMAGARLHVIAGGGLRLATLTEVVRRSGNFSLHGSLTRKNGHRTPQAAQALLEADVREAVRLLQHEYRETADGAVSSKSHCVK
jgi:copper homeostasis protein